ncbi:DUF1904 family protein [Acidaminobacter hydrogenoformans]|uniref:DUF1904 domain-containing protein n=1 Tax=Acidaminobacter hydrogenoformans DSM 2784 TaxID=1120920 RepID=A0A1G5S5Z3_9FIRM|nr:DUF1904 family protein [Acidaminobacter hydrogenoformans]SCZ81764.1 protein of unknown function [Acidaminobacter hydrogenoformans DSM 2784]
MPHLTFAGVKPEEIKEISTVLTDTLAEIADAPRDYFTYEVKENSFIFDGEIVNINPVIEVSWFDRGQHVKDEMASAIDQAFRRKGYDRIEIIFEPLEKESYFENAEHY